MPKFMTNSHNRTVGMYFRILSTLLVLILAEPDKQYDERQLSRRRSQAERLHRKPHKPYGRRKPPEARDDPHEDDGGVKQDAEAHRPTCGTQQEPRCEHPLADCCQQNEGAGERP